MLKNKIPPPIVTLVFAALIYFSSKWSSNIAFSGQNLISLFLMAVGLIVLLIAISAFIKLKTTINPLNPEAASSLVTTGIFRLSRNPMYVGLLLLIISLWVKTGAVSGFILIIFKYYLRSEQ
jgi:protein-S-isoprenylcysteine O-methyltransferase Ste14